MKSELLKLQKAIEMFDDFDLGFPKGDCRIFKMMDPALLSALYLELNISKESTLAEFYQHCGGISLPDVDNGYYLLSPVEIVAVNRMGSEPDRFGDREMIIFGRDGGGGRYVIVRGTDELYYLPMAEVTAGREYFGNPKKLDVSGIAGLISGLSKRIAVQ